MTENSMISKMTNGTVIVGDTVADDNESFAESSYIHRYDIISTSATAATLFLIIVGVLCIVVICIYQVRKRRRQDVCRNLERQYETVDEPIYEMILNNNPNTEVWSDYNTKCNEAYQKTSLPLHLCSELSEQ